jgi:hypothetical protein
MAGRGKSFVINPEKTTNRVKFDADISQDFFADCQEVEFRSDKCLGRFYLTAAGQTACENCRYHRGKMTEVPA